MRIDLAAFNVASNVNVSNFVPVSLLTKRNYTLWKEQMLCLLNSQDLRGLVDATVDQYPEFENPDIKKKCESLVKCWIFRSLNEDMLQKVGCYDNPRHLWERLERLYNPEEVPADDNDDIPARVQNVLSTPTPPDNYIRDKKLVEVVVDERWWAAKSILKPNYNENKITTLHGLTMLHIAVIESRNNFLKSLLDFLKDDDIMITKATNEDDGNKTALHHAALFNNKRAAKLLVKKCDSLLSLEDNKKRIPLCTAFENQNLDTFLYLWEASENAQNKPEAITRTLADIHQNINFDIVEDAISTKQYDIASRLVSKFTQVAKQDDQLMKAMATTFPSDLGFGEALICPSPSNFHQRIVKRSSSLFNALRDRYDWAHDFLWSMRSFKEAMRWLLVVPVAVLCPLYQLIRLFILVILYPFFMLYILLWRVVGIAVIPIKRIEKKRKKYEEAKKFMNMICDQIHKFGYLDYNHPCYTKPFLEAICHGAYEVVDEILYRSPNLIRYKSGDENHSFIELAITNRSEKIYNLIYHLKDRMDQYRNFEDSSGNNILHLAGRLAPARILNRTTGAALQLQRELQWFQEVEKLMLPRDLLKKNTHMETPAMVFTREHAGLVKEGENWMKTTSEACSITAALMVTIVFAAAITVPGGNNQEIGIPLFRKKVAFTIFAVCDAISLFSAISALLVFLSILTTRFAEMDFLVSLPRRLVIGLSMLFLSTTSMMVAFSAILYLVFCDQSPWMLAPIGGLTCMPIAVIVTLQLPLLVDLFKSTYIPIFGKQKYIASGKFISNHPAYYIWETGTTMPPH